MLGGRSARIRPALAMDAPHRRRLTLMPDWTIRYPLYAPAL